MRRDEDRSADGAAVTTRKTEAGAFRTVLDREKCSLCEMCAYKCPTGALSLNRVSDTEQLLFTARLCDACNGEVVCQTLCPEKAIEIVEGEKGSPVPADEKVIMDGEMAACLGCGVPFMPLPKLRTLLRQAKVEEKEIQKYCPDCRRKRLVANYPIPDGV